MRHIRTRRRFKLILATLFVFCLVLFLENRIGSLMPRLKHVLETRAQEMLGNRVRLSIDRVDGGIFNTISLGGIKIRNAKSGQPFPAIVIDRIKTNYRIWDIFIEAKDGSLLSNLLPKDSRIDVNFTNNNRDLRGFARLEGDLANPKFIGSVTAFNKNRIDFSGAVTDDRFELEIRLPKGIVRLRGTVAEDGTIAAEVKTEHLRLGGFDITCEGDLKNSMVLTPNKPKERYFEGEFVTKKFILNYKPFLNLKASYKVGNSRLEIPELDIGDIFKVYGKALLRAPYAVNFTLVANNVSIAWLLAVLRCEEASSVISGTMNGKFEFKGPVKKLKLNARMDIRNGTIAKLDFSTLSATLRGDLPFVRIEDSRITRESGYFALAGEMDLRRMGRGNLFDDIKLVSDDNAITWDELNTAQSQYSQEITMTKKLTDDMSIDFKKVIGEGRIDESLRDHDEVQFEYKLHPNESLKMMMGQDGSFLGLEHKDKF